MRIIKKISSLCEMTASFATVQIKNYTNANPEALASPFGWVRSLLWQVTRKQGKDERTNQVQVTNEIASIILTIPWSKTWTAGPWRPHRGASPSSFSAAWRNKEKKKKEESLKIASCLPAISSWCSFSLFDTCTQPVFSMWFSSSRISFLMYRLPFRSSLNVY